MSGPGRWPGPWYREPGSAPAGTGPTESESASSEKMLIVRPSAHMAPNADTTEAGMATAAAWLPVNWTWKLEYLYLDLGSLDAGTPFAITGLIHGFPINPISPAVGTITTHTHFTDNIVRVGLNYKFDN